MFSRIFCRRPDRGVVRVFEGEVIRADTRQPVAGTRVTILAKRKSNHTWYDSTGLRDAAGTINGAGLITDVRPRVNVDGW
jgi:hypothetical protein